MKAKIQDVKRRYEADAALVLDVLVSVLITSSFFSQINMSLKRQEEPFKTHCMSTVLTQEDLLWAWLNGMQFPSI